MKLFMFYLGGMIPGCNIELHDVQFGVAERAEDCHGYLKSRWWGIPETLHIDCWAEIKQIDGFSIGFETAPRTAQSDNKLFFVNLGGYADSAEFSERHANILVVAPDAVQAKVNAVRRIQDWPGRHMDKVTEVETVVDVFKLTTDLGHQIVLAAGAEEMPLDIQHQYIPIGKQDAQE